MILNLQAISMNAFHESIMRRNVIIQRDDK